MGELRKLHLGAAILAALLLSGCATSVGYLWKQGRSLLHYSLGAKKIQSILSDPATPPDLRAFLREVEAIKAFATAKIGLAENRNYTTYKRIDRNYLVNVVQAADRLSFTAYEWDYPLLGKLPYKGYYDPADAQAEAKRLTGAGYDVIVRKVDAFSTLGFLPDPVYSYMRSYTPYDLASLIIHEETHATLFLKGQDQFNEGLATYVGDEGALEYLKATYGASSRAYEQGIAEQHDNKLFLAFIDKLKAALAVVYRKPESGAEKLAEKAQTIAAYRQIYEMDYRPRFQTKGYRSLSDLPINNAYLMLFGLYTNDVGLFRRYNRTICGGDLKTLMDNMKRIARQPGKMMPKIERELTMLHSGLSVRHRRGNFSERSHV